MRSSLISRGSQEGQAVVEYLLTIMSIIAIVGIIKVTFSRSLFTLWQGMTREISAACPGCPPDPRIRYR